MALLNHFHPLSKLERVRKKALDTRLLPDFIQANLRQPYPSIEEDVSSLQYICLDLETTGLDPKNDKILSFGWVTITDFHVDLASNVEIMVNDGGNVSEKTAVINHITPEMLEAGVSLDDAVLAFFEHAIGKVIVAHGCVVEREFLNHYFKERFHLAAIPLLWIDTLAIEKHLSKLSDCHDQVDLRLSSVRERYDLPAYNAHGALIDAIATAELLLAQIKRIYRDKKSGFGRLYSISQP